MSAVHCSKRSLNDRRATSLGKAIATSGSRFEFSVPKLMPQVQARQAMNCLFGCVANNQSCPALSPYGICAGLVCLDRTLGKYQPISSAVRARVRIVAGRECDKTPWIIGKPNEVEAAPANVIDIADVASGWPERRQIFV
jgi:hypothetical protein